VGIDLYKYLTMTDNPAPSLDEGRDPPTNTRTERAYNLGDFPLFPVCGLEAEYVLCANPLFRHPYLTEIVWRKVCGDNSDSCRLVEYQVPHTYSPYPKRVVGAVRAWYIKGGVPVPPDADPEVEEGKMLVLSKNGVDDETAARVCASLKPDDFCLSGNCFLEAAGGGAGGGQAQGTYAATLLVVGDFNGDGMIGNRCRADNETVISFLSFGWCKGCSAVNAHALRVDVESASAPQPPTVSGVWNGSHLRGINRPAGGDAFDKVDNALLPPLFRDLWYDIWEEVWTCGERRDLSWPYLSPPQGVLKEHMRDWLKRGNVVILFPTSDFLDDRFARLSLLKDLAGYEVESLADMTERKDIPIGAVVVAVPPLSSPSAPKYAVDVKKTCPTCIVAPVYTPSTIDNLYTFFGLSPGQVCERRDIPGELCNTSYDASNPPLYPLLGAVILNVTVDVEPCRGPEDYYPIFEEWTAISSEVAERLGLPTIIYISRLEGDSYPAICDGRAVSPYKNFFTALASYKRELINKGVWGIYIEDLALPRGAPDEQFSLYDASLQPRQEALEDFNYLLRVMVVQPVMVTRPVGVGNCTTCVEERLCLNRDWQGETVNPEGIPITSLTVECSDGWRGPASTLLEEALSGSPVAQGRLGSLTYYTGLTLCGENTTYSLVPMPSLSAAVFAFCEQGDVECHKKGADVYQILSAMAPFSNTVCWPTKKAPGGGPIWED